MEDNKTINQTQAAGEQQGNATPKLKPIFPTTPTTPAAPDAATANAATDEEQRAAQVVATVGADIARLDNPPSTTKREEPQHLFSLRELLEMDIKEIPCLFAPVFQKSGLAVVIGESDLGKSAWLRQMCMCVAAGKDFMGWKFNGTYMQAIYLSSEDDQNKTAKFVRDYNITMKLEGDALDRLRFEFKVEADKIRERLEELLKEQPADLIVIDAFGDVFEGKNMNDNAEVRAFYAQFEEIIRVYECLIIFNHHAGKRSSQFAPGKDNTLGSQAIEAKPRLVIELRRDPDNPTLKHICIDKCNYLSDDYKWRSFEMRTDENFVFWFTGERVDFDDLAQKQGNKRKTPQDVSKEKHLEFVSTIKDKTNQGKLAKAVASWFGIGTRYAIDYVNYYELQGWVKVEDGKGREKLYSKTIQ